MFHDNNKLENVEVVDYPELSSTPDDRRWTWTYLQQSRLKFYETNSCLKKQPTP